MKFRYEMHQHLSPCSHCGHADPIELVTNLKAEGFAGCVITDHFYHGNTGIDRGLCWDEFCKPYEEEYLKAKETAKRLDFDILFGIEESVGEGKEVLIYGVTPEFMYKNPQLREGGLETVYRAVKTNNGIVIQAHPFRHRDYIKAPLERLNADFLDGYEIFNASNKPEDNTLALDIYGNSGKILTAGSDCHRPVFDKIRAGIETECRISSEKELGDILRSGCYCLFGTDV